MPDKITIRDRNRRRSGGLSSDRPVRSEKRRTGGDRFRTSRRSADRRAVRANGALPAGIRIPDRPRILITRLSHIGDCILTLPVAATLKKRFPGCTIGWAVEKPSDQLLQLCPYVDEIIHIDRNWLKSPGGWLRMRRTLRPYRFDLSVDPQSITKSSILGFVSGAGQRIGQSGKWSRELAPWLNNRQIPVTSTHLVDRSLGILAPLGIRFQPQDDRLTFPMRPCKTSAANMQEWMLQNGLDAGSFVLINPGASWPSKRWEPERFGSVAAAVHRTTGMRSVVVWAGEEEKRMADEVCRVATGSGEPQSAVLSAPATSLRELMELTRRANFFLGCDTGPMHLAVAVGAPCVGLYGPTRPEDSGAYGTQNIAIQKRYHSGTSRERRSANNDAMREITVDDVAEACRRMIDRTGTYRAVAG